VEQVTEALRILADDPKVQVILVNIFGGIMRCDTVAAGLVKAVEILALKKPLVVRLQGTNLEQGKQLLHASTLKIIPADDLEEAASRSCKVASFFFCCSGVFRLFSRRLLKLCHWPRSSIWTSTLVCLFETEGKKNTSFYFSHSQRDTANRSD